MQLPDPTSLTWQEWAATATGYNPSFGQYVHPAMLWPDFANALIYLLPETPRPDGFKSWQEWAVALKLAVSS